MDSFISLIDETVMNLHPELENSPGGFFEETIMPYRHAVLKKVLQKASIAGNPLTGSMEESPFDTRISDIYDVTARVCKAARDDGGFEARMISAAIRETAEKKGKTAPTVSASCTVRLGDINTAAFSSLVCKFVGGEPEPFI